jgi:hypothetical protein
MGVQVEWLTEETEDRKGTVWFITQQLGPPDDEECRDDPLWGWGRRVLEETDDDAIDFGPYWTIEDLREGLNHLVEVNERCAYSFAMMLYVRSHRGWSGRYTSACGRPCRDAVG